MEGIYSRTVLRGNEALDCFVLREPELTAREIAEVKSGESKSDAV